jgi:large subunit ribosomal protein L19
MNIVSLVENKKNPKIPELSPGDTVKVSARIVEGGKERIQVFQGVVIQVRPGGPGASFTVRHVAFGIGVERTFPYYSPLVEKVEIVRHGKVRRSRLYYLRNLSGRQARRKIKRVEKKVEAIGGELLEPEPEEVLEPEDVLGEEAEAMAEEQSEVVTEAAAKEEIEVTEEAAAEAEEKPEALAGSVAEVEKEPEVVAEPAAEETTEAIEEPVAEEQAGEPEVVLDQEEEKPEDAKS